MILASLHPRCSTETVIPELSFGFSNCYLLDSIRPYPNQETMLNPTMSMVHVVGKRNISAVKAEWHICIHLPCISYDPQSRRGERERERERGEKKEGEERDKKQQLGSNSVRGTWDRIEPTIKYK